ncbi:MAG TPA: M14 family metallopeptidase [Chloroflexaceae bacterium]|mgnify:CR=1 FL=1|nr:M14 family metallopeptidase [Chloroflexaceae bacterium]
MKPRNNRPARRALTALALALALALAALTGAPQPRSAHAATVRAFTLGETPQGRPVEVVQFGDGPRKLVVVGNTHGAPEANTYRLTLELIEHFRANPGLVPPTVRLFFIPSLNPDGLAIGWRFDAAGVDLNRNMNTNLDACPENDWRTTVQGAYGLVADTGGPYPDSQRESRLIRAFLLDAAGAIFIHSNAGLVFPAACEHPPSIAMAETYAAAAGYSYSRFWPLYNITGGMHDWAGSLGIASITPELITGDQSEFAQNLAGLLAVLADAEALLPPPEDGEVAGQVVPAAIYRYWRALGGEARFGPPLGPARAAADGVSQTFLNARIGLRDDLRDTVYYVQPEPLGAAAARDLAYGGAAALAPAAAAPGATFFAETGHNLSAGFRDFWQRGGGLDVFGLPLSEEFTARAADGQARTLQYFERAVFAYDPEGGVRLEPLGARALVLETLLAPAAPQSVR